MEYMDNIGERERLGDVVLTERETWRTFNLLYKPFISSASAAAVESFRKNLP